MVLVGGDVARPGPDTVGAVPGEARAHDQVLGQGEIAHPAPERRLVGHGGLHPRLHAPGDAFTDLQRPGVDARQSRHGRLVVAVREQGGQIARALGQQQLRLGRGEAHGLGGAGHEP